MLVRKSQGQYLVVLDKDAPLVKSLTDLVGNEEILGGQICGIGALKQAELGYYELEQQDYIRQTFSREDYELISLNGNLSLKEGKPFVHVHAALGQSNFQVIGGHLFEALVAVTAEIFITPFGVMPERQLNTEIGLHTIARCPIKE